MPGNLSPRIVKTLMATAVLSSTLLLAAAPAFGSVTGPCDGSATWDSPPLVVVASQVNPDEPVIIPLEGTVTWTGSISIPQPDEPRDVSGNVKVALPYPLGLVNIGNWATSGTLIENSGTYTYDFPTLLSGFTVTVEAEHWEGTLTQAGEPTCTGSATLALEGTNPIGFIAGGLAVVCVLGVSLSVRVKGPSAGGRRS